MRIKTFTILLYMLAGLAIAIFTSFMTYVIIGKPIKMPMVEQIIIVVLSVAPAIGILSYFFGQYLSKKFIFIQERLERAKEQDFSLDKSHSMLVEIDEINQNINYLSIKMDSLIVDLRQKNKNLSDLLVSMAHDIKTPITILTGHIEEIEDGLVKIDMLPKVFAQMKDELEFMDELTVDMLKFIESIGSKRAKDDVNVHDVIDDKVFPMLPKKEQVIYLNEVDKDLIIPFNHIDFKCISINILMNATKFIDTGHIRVYNDGDIIVFENTGDKIDLALKKEIFEPFYTVDKSKNRKQSGFGLGLSIVKNLSQSNEYHCYLDESNDDMTIFKLEPLPLACKL